MNTIDIPIRLSLKMKFNSKPSGKLSADAGTVTLTTKGSTRIGFGLGFLWAAWSFVILAFRQFLGIHS